MHEERGRVVAIEAGSIWVETIQRSACGGCSARSGCGTGLLGDFLSRSTRIRVDLNSWDKAHVALNDTAIIGIPERALSTGALLAYILPLIFLLLGALAGDALAGEAGAIAGAVAGLLGGAGAIRWHGRRNAASPLYSPVLLRIEPSRPSPR
ncbi:SoxR reducing system RseC family protein [Microbulbifer yueqingensis]|uniref:Positive regulator of sigma(E), RseC/MucC n=1 Tax=Microbulbifer yueqingensis TaxID=658219 RepID=A0A1G8UUC4_9GAMM|nr:SoxR reducing system RseC family protein [Microbulbifer yueqingensis]SDJ56540.1 positive regulator of sigma(E), RseC/MucC [Microbulbifer yueqingensis]